MAKIKKVFCKNCGKCFHRSSGRFNEAIKFGWNQYCSSRCEFKFKNKRQILKCENCGKKLERSPHAISPHNYCSHYCAIMVNNIRYPRKNRAKPILKTCVFCKNQYRKSSGNTKYCSMKCRIEVEHYTPKKLLNIIKDTVQKLGRVPARRESLKGVNRACIRFFGSWNKAIMASGFTPNRSHNNRMYKRVITRAIDGHSCDSISELLIDNWLYKNGAPHERDAHYPETNHRADWAIMVKTKKIFVEYFGLANDSPRYDRSIEEKKKLCNENNIPLISIYPKDLYPKNLLENNLKSKFQNFLNV